MNLQKNYHVSKYILSVWATLHIMILHKEKKYKTIKEKSQAGNVSAFVLMALKKNLSMGNIRNPEKGGKCSCILEQQILYSTKPEPALC